MGILVPEYLRRRDHNYFENWARRMGMKPYDRKRREQHADILLADSGCLITTPASDEGHEKFYRTGFCIYRDKAWIASSWTYPPDCFPSESEHGKQSARVKECLKYAREYLALFVEKNLFNPDDTGSFSELIH